MNTLNCVYIGIHIYKHTQSFCSATQCQKAWTPCKEISYVLTALRQATGSTRQRTWYLSCHPFLFIYVYVFLYVLYTFFWFGLLQRLHHNFKLMITYKHSSLTKQYAGMSVSGCTCLDFALSSLLGSGIHYNSVPCQWKTKQELKSSWSVSFSIWKPSWSQHDCVQGLHQCWTFVSILLEK